MFSTLVAYQIYTGGALPPLVKRAYEYLLAGNGVFLRAENRFVQVILPLTTVEVRGLAPLTTHIRLRIPRLPPILLKQVLHDARQARRSNGQLHEVLYHFRHDGHAVRVDKPPQVATTTRVASLGDGGLDTILDLHSHGNMPAFWSAVDNADEGGFRFYAVIGRLDERPEIKLRLGAYGYHVDVPLTTLFVGPTVFHECARLK
jgi:PRTRC genetic system protein A